MQIPPYLKKGDTIAITCPSGHIAQEAVLEAQKQLQTWGFKVIIGDTVRQSENYFSAPDEVKIADLQGFLDDDGIAAVLMGRGGYGMGRIIDQLDFTRFVVRPKWICGFSDITVLHSHIQTTFGIASLHGPMCSSFTETNMQKDFLRSFRLLITGGAPAYPVPACEHNIPGKAKGVLVGGNLAMLAHLSGSVSAMNAHAKVLFIEDVGEHLYNIDRMLYNLRRSGAFDKLCGVICGGFTDLQDTVRPFGQDIYQILLHHFGGSDIPVVFDFPSGHIDENHALCLGAVYDMDVSKEESKIRLLC